MRKLFRFSSLVLIAMYRFLKSRPNMEEFLGELLHFQHFQQFINSKIEKLKSRNVERDIFDNEVLAYEEGECCCMCYLLARMIGCHLMIWNMGIIII